VVIAHLPAPATACLQPVQLFLFAVFAAALLGTSALPSACAGVPARAAQAQRPCASDSASRFATRGAGGCLVCVRARP